MCYVVVMCFFDCKCKSLKRLGENIYKRKRKKHKETSLKKKTHKNSKTNI